MTRGNWVANITAYDIENAETFRLMLNADEIVSIAEDTFEIFDEKTGAWIEHKGCEIYVHDYCYKVLDAYESFVGLAFPKIKKPERGRTTHGS